VGEKSIKHKERRVVIEYFNGVKADLSTQGKYENIYSKTGDIGIPESHLGGAEKHHKSRVELRGMRRGMRGGGGRGGAGTKK